MWSSFLGTKSALKSAEDGDLEEVMFHVETGFDVNVHFPKTWRTLVVEDEQPYRPHSKST